MAEQGVAWRGGAGGGGGASPPYSNFSSVAATRSACRSACRPECARKDVNYARIELPGWGCSVCVSSRAAGRCSNSVTPAACNKDVSTKGLPCNRV